MKIKKLIKNAFFFVLDGLSVLEKRKPLEKDKIHNILAAEGGGIGDLLRIFPALEALKDNFPDATLTLLASPSAQKALPLFSRKEIISEIIDYDPHGMQKGLMNKIRFIAMLRSKKFDMVYSPDRGEGMREENLLSLLTGADYRLGFRKGRAGSHNTFSIEFKEDVPILRQNLDILKDAGLKSEIEEVRLSIPGNDLIEVRKMIGRDIQDVSKPLISIHPGASWYTSLRCWPLHRYISLIDLLVREVGAEVVILGSADEHEAGTRIRRKIDNPALIDLTGKLTVPQMAAAIKLSDLFIGNDSGPLHISEAVGTPYVGIFGPTSHRQVLSGRPDSITITGNAECAPCYLHQCNFEMKCTDMKCLQSISVEKVYDSARKILFRRK